MTIEKRQLAFADELRRLREQAGFATGKDFAKHIGWLASKVSRVENGRTVPADSDVIAWVDAINAPEVVASRLRDQLRDLRLSKSSWKRQLRAGHEHVQSQFAEREQAAAHIVMVEFYIIPGLVQTAEYARAVFTAAAEKAGTVSDTDAAVLARLRRQNILYDPAKQIDLLIAETALLYPITTAATLRGQIDRLISMIGMPNVRIGIIPLRTKLPIVSMHGFTVTDDEITVEINHTEVPVTDSEDIAVYQRIVDGLWSVAVEGDDARALLARVAADLG